MEKHAELTFNVGLYFRSGDYHYWNGPVDEFGCLVSKFGVVRHKLKALIRGLPD
ncbi:hypothetical protein EMIT0111MI5_80225 [Burkholderia sp. IT-111MI5]